MRSPRCVVDRSERREVSMTDSMSVHGFDVAETLEPTPPRDERIAEVIGLAEYLEPSASTSETEIERSATEISDAVRHDGELLRDAQRVAQQRLSQGRCTGRVVSLLAAARRRLRGERRGHQIVITGEHDRLVLKVSGPLTAHLGRRLEEVVNTAMEITPAVALDLREVDAVDGRRPREPGPMRRSRGTAREASRSAVTAPVSAGSPSAPGTQPRVHQGKCGQHTLEQPVARRSRCGVRGGHRLRSGNSEC